MSRALLARRLTQDVTLLLRTPGAEDDHGNPADVPIPQVVKGFAGQQVRSEGAGGMVVGEGLALFLEAGSPVTGWDACVIDGNQYEVIGHPWQVFNPRTIQVHHVRADIRRAGTSG